MKINFIIPLILRSWFLVLLLMTTGCNVSTNVRVPTAIQATEYFDCYRNQTTRHTH